MQNSTNFKIDLNAKSNFYGRTALHHACSNGTTECVKMMIENAESSKLDLKIKANDGRTAFQLAEFAERTDIVNLIKRKLPTGTF